MTTTTATAPTKQELQTFLASKLNRNLQMYFDSCQRCGLCAEACQYYVATRDPKMIPAYKAEQVRRLYRQPSEWSQRLFPWFVHDGALDEARLGALADVVFGSRLKGGRPQRAYLFWHLLGNRFLSLLTGVLFNTTLSDMETGYKVFRAEVVKGLRLRSKRFDFEPEVTAKLAKHRFRLYEVPISYSGRDYQEGKKITWRDGLAAIYWIVRYRIWD